MYQYPYGNAQQLNLDWILNKIQEIEAGNTQVNIEEVANTLVSASFDAGVAYRRYDYCFYNGKLYRAVNDTSGAFNPADWLEVVIGDDIPVLTRLLNAVDASLTTLQGQVADLDSDDVDNASNVTGTTVSNALNTLLADVQDTAAALAYIAIGNTHSAIDKNKYIFVTLHPTLTQGLYLTNSALPANEPLTDTNLRSVSIGGLNNLIPEIYTTAEGITVIEFSFGLLIQTGRVSVDFHNTNLEQGTITLPRYYNGTTFTVVGNSASTSVNTYLLRVGCYATTNNSISWSAGTGDSYATSATGRLFTWFSIGMAAGF